MHRYQISQVQLENGRDCYRPSPLPRLFLRYHQDLSGKPDEVLGVSRERKTALFLTNLNKPLALRIESRRCLVQQQNPTENIGVIVARTLHMHIDLKQ
jgi:hypothetical protein